jgi:hypothetical protein
VSAAQRSRGRRSRHAAPHRGAQATTGGRQLLDRKKQRAVQRNAAAVLAALRAQAGCSAAALQSLLLHWPHLLELDASQEWEARFCALALRLHGARGGGGGGGGAPACGHQAAWEEEQREAARLGLLPPARAALLDGAGFDWGLVDRDWEAQFDELVAFALGAGHADVLRAGAAARPGAPDAPAPALQEWARRQLALHRLGTLPAAAQARLQAVGFPLGAPLQQEALPPPLPPPPPPPPPPQQAPPQQQALRQQEAAAARRGSAEPAAGGGERRRAPGSGRRKARPA